MTTLHRKVQRDHDRRHPSGDVSPRKQARKPAQRRRREAVPIDYPGGRRRHASDFRAARRKAERERRKAENKADSQQVREILSTNAEARAFVKSPIYRQSREAARRVRQASARSVP
jgi:hypothetical protein